MKKICFGFAAFLLGSCLLYGSSTGVPINNVADPTSQVMVSSENTATLTPRRSDAPVMRGIEPVSQVAVRENPIPPAPSLNGSTQRLAQVEYAPVPAVAWNDNGGSGNDSFVLSELDRLGAELEKLNARTAPPDTRRAWSAPRIGGRMFFDSINFTNQRGMPDAEDRPRYMPNTAGISDFRLGAQGTGFESFDYRMEIVSNSRNGQVTITDCWIGAKNVPVLGYLRVGHMMPETGLYRGMGSQNTSLMQYPGAADVFWLGRRVGILSQHLFANNRVRLGVGVFQSEATNLHRHSARDNQGQIVTVRLTTAPIFEQNGKYLLHFGGNWAHVGNFGNGIHGAGNRTSLSTTPGQFGMSIPTSLTTGAFDNRYSNRGGLEVAMQYGRFSARSEAFFASFGEHDEANNRKLSGAYIELGHFLTEGYRNYDLETAVFTGVNTYHNNFRPISHCGRNMIDRLGAFQTVFNWSYLDMTDWRGGNGYGGFQHDFSAGLNWFWTPQLRWMFQYVHSRQCIGGEHDRRSQDIFATSLRVHF